MTVRFKWEGGRAKWAVRSAIADGMEKASLEFVKLVKRKINTPYPPASRPGEPPHRRTGNLRANIDYWINRKELKVMIGPTEDAEYGIYLEYGAPRANLEPRPFLKPSMDEMAPRVQSIVGRAAQTAFKKFGRSGE